MTHSRHQFVKQHEPIVFLHFRNTSYMLTLIFVSYIVLHTPPLSPCGPRWYHDLYYVILPAELFHIRHRGTHITTSNNKGHSPLLYFLFGWDMRKLIASWVGACMHGFSQKEHWISEAPFANHSDGQRTNHSALTFALWRHYSRSTLAHVMSCCLVYH